jgi:hypothetical protein
MLAASRDHRVEPTCDKHPNVAIISHTNTRRAWLNIFLLHETSQEEWWSGDLPPPSREGQKNTASQDKTGQSSTDVGDGHQLSVVAEASAPMDQDHCRQIFSGYEAAVAAQVARFWNSAATGTLVRQPLTVKKKGSIEISTGVTPSTSKSFF